MLVGTIISLFFLCPLGYDKSLNNTISQNSSEQVNKAPVYGFDETIIYVDKKVESPAFYAPGYKNKESKAPAEPHALFKIANVFANHILMLPLLIRSVKGVCIWIKRSRITFLKLFGEYGK